MADLFDLKYGIAGICVLLTLHILVRVAIFAFEMQKKKQSASEKAVEDLTAAVLASTKTIEHLQASIAELPKIKTDIRRFYIAVKFIAGDDWPKIRKEIMEEDLTL